MTDHLRPVIIEIAAQLDFLPIEKVSRLIANMIADLMPYAILEMEETSLPSSQEMKSAEFKIKRTGGRSQDDVDDLIASKRAIYEDVKEAKSMLVNEYPSQGTALVVMPLKDHSSSYPHPTVQSSLSSLANQYMLRSHVLSTMAEEDRSEQHFATPRGSKLQYKVEDSVAAKIASDELFRRFCSIVEGGARGFASIHRNDWNFLLKESKNPVEPNWMRLILLVQFTGVHIETSMKLWSTLSNVIRERLEMVRKQLPDEDKKRFDELISRFNVVLDY